MTVYLRVPLPRGITIEHLEKDLSFDKGLSQNCRLVSLFS
jgi:hypothetical protein